jgi:hypothetical protein
MPKCRVTVQYTTLEVAYGMLFGQLELVMVKIKKRGELTPELEGEALIADV